MSNEFVALLANIALTLSVIVAVIFGIAQIKSSHKDRKERLTLETLRHFQSMEFAATLHFINRTQLPATYEEWQAFSTEDQVRLIQLSQQMESLGLLLAERLISVDLLDKTLGSFITNSWQQYKPVILDMREKLNDPYLSEYFQWMAEQIDKRMTNCPRRPFFMTSQNAE